MKIALYRVIPRGLYIASVVFTSNTNRATLAATRSWICEPRVTLDNVVFAATLARKLQKQNPRGGSLREVQSDDIDYLHLQQSSFLAITK
jgi:hypothetical protein